MEKLSYPEELVALLEECLSVGTISGRARQVLLNKAQSLGVDIDEFDLYIDAQQKKVINQDNSDDSKMREVLCPFCGAPVPPLAEKCPNCNNFIEPKANKELTEIINHLEDALVELKLGKDMARNKANVERYVLKAQTYYENYPKVKKLLEGIKAEATAAEKRAEEAERVREEAKRARKCAEEEAERVRKQAERARKCAEEEAERARKQAERAREEARRASSKPENRTAPFLLVILVIETIIYCGLLILFDLIGDKDLVDVTASSGFMIIIGTFILLAISFGHNYNTTLNL